MKFGFQTTIGDDIEVEVVGHYYKPEPAVGFLGSFDVESVSLKDNNINIISLIDAKTLLRLEDKGTDKGYEEYRLGDKNA